MGNQKQLVYGYTDYGLTDLGRHQSEHLRKKLASIEFAHCYTSKLCRAYDTAELILRGRDTVITRHEELNEQNFGIYEDKKVPFEVDHANFETAINDFVHGEIPQGESYDEMAKRSIEFVQNHAKEGENNLFVAHNGPLGAITAALLGLPIEYAHRFHYRQGCFALIEITYGHPKLRFFNK